MINHSEPRMRPGRRHYQLMTALRLPAHRAAILIPYLEVGLEVVWLTNVVNRGEVEQQIEGEFGIVAQDTQSRNDLLARDVNPIIAQRTLVFNDEVAQAARHFLQKWRERWSRGRRFAVVVSGHNGGAGNRCGS